MPDRKNATKATIAATVERMTGALRREYEQARVYLRDAVSTDARARYRIGQIVLEIRRGTARYGDLAVSLFATALARDESTLLRYARVAETWDEGTFATLLSLRMPGGEPLTWAHLTAIAFGAPEERERLVAETIEHGLSVQALSALVTGAGPESSRPSHHLERLQRLVETWTSFVRFRIDDTSLSRLPATFEARAALRDAITAQERVIEIAGRNIEQLRRAEVKMQADDGEAETMPPPRLFGFKPKKGDS